MAAVSSQPQTRRSVGKLMSRPVAIQEQRELLGTSKIKIEEDSENGSQLNFEGNTVKESKKGEELI